MWRAHRALVFVGLIVLAPEVGAEEKPASEGWAEVTVETAAPAKLSDLRSPIVKHETRVANGAAVSIGGDSLLFEVDSNGRSVKWRRTQSKSDGKAKVTSGRLRLPGLLELLGIHGMRYPLWVRVAPGNDGVLIGSAYGSALPLEGATGYVVDSDRDGVLGSAGDGVVAPESRTVGAWRGEVWTARAGRRFRKDAKGAWEMASIPPPHPKNADHVAAWCLLQWRRQQCGILPVEYDATLEEAMRRHAEYADRNGEETHEEVPGRPGYSPAGDAAGRSSVIGWEEKSRLSGLSVQLATMYHRTRVLQPGLTHTALVFHKGIFMLNVFARRGGPLKDAILVYPPHGMENVMTRFHPSGERPMPTKERPGVLGTAVNVFCEPMREAKALRTAPSLSVQYGRRRKAVEGALHYPGHPPDSAAGPSNRGNVAVVPKRMLRLKTEYACATQIAMPGGSTFSYEWTFRTPREEEDR